MRILLVTYGSFPQGAGGVGLLLDSQARELAKRGHQVLVVSGGAARQELSEPETERVSPRYTIVRLPELTRSPLGLPPHRGTSFESSDIEDDLKARFQAIRDAFKPDIVQAHDFHKRSVGDAKALLSVFHDLPVAHHIYTVDGMGEGADALVLPWAWQTTISGALAGYMPRGSLHSVHYPSFDPKLFDPETATPDPAIMKLNGTIFVHPAGRVKQRKGVLASFEAFRRVLSKLPDSQLVITLAPDVGNLLDMDIEFFEQFRSQVRALNLENRVHLLVRNRSQMPGVFAATAAKNGVMVHPSLNEAFGVVIVEAQAMKVPVIVTSVQGQIEAVNHGSAGFIVPPGDVESLSRAMHLLATDRALCDQLTLGGTDHAKHFHEADAIDRLVDVYETLVGSNRRNGLEPPSHNIQRDNVT